MARQKIAVLGGGTGSMAAVWALTQLPDWEERFEITVYQMGWRLGGKGASGRNAARHMRIEEHGLHVWAGFYENAFRLIREVYDDFEPPEGSPIQTWRDAFLPQHEVIVEEFVGGEWVHWPVDWPPRPGQPGDSGYEPPHVWGYIVRLLSWLVEAFLESPLYEDAPIERGGVASLWEELTGGDDRDEVTPQTPRELGVLGGLRHLAPTQLVKAAHDFAGWLSGDVLHHLGADHIRLIHLLEEALEVLREDFYEELDEHDDARRLYYALDMGMGMVKGLIGDQVIFRGWDSIDDQEWSEWMRRWGVSDYTLDGVAVRGLYDYVFGFPDGDFERPRLAAGTATHGMLRLAFDGRGAIFFFMAAGMGDIVYAPLYRVLERRGVRFRFFSKVENLGLSDDAQRVDTITLTEQATLTSGDPFGYEPLEDIKGVWSWPSTPRFEQLEQGEELERRGINLESNWADWDGVGTLELERGRDFDEVILGIPPTSFPYICPELMQADSQFKRMVQGLESTQTQAVQLWFGADRARLGAPSRPVVVTGYVDPINTWSDMTHLIPREEWGGEEEVHYVAYFCGPMTDADPIPDFDDHDFPARELARVKDTAIAWMRSNAAHIWKESGSAISPAGLDWDLLAGPGSGVERMDAQYFRANIDPSERYILSVPGSTRQRLRAGESGFENVYLAGDWVYTSLSAGCIECAVMGGLHAAEAVSGDRVEITDRAY